MAADTADDEQACHRSLCIDDSDSRDSNRWADCSNCRPARYRATKIFDWRHRARILLLMQQRCMCFIVSSLLPTTLPSIRACSVRTALFGRAARFLQQLKPIASTTVRIEHLHECASRGDGRRRAQCCDGRIKEIILLRCTQSKTVGQISAVGVLITNHSTMPPPVSLSRSDERRVELATPFVRWAQCRVGLSVRSTFSCPSTHALAAQRSASHRLVASLQRVVPPFLTFLPIFSTRRSRAWLGWLLRATARVGATALSRVRTLAPVGSQARS